MEIDYLLYIFLDRGRKNSVYLVSPVAHSPSIIIFFFFFFFFFLANFISKFAVLLMLQRQKQKRVHNIKNGMSPL
jgi:hypothetical protein